MSPPPGWPALPHIGTDDFNRADNQVNVGQANWAGIWDFNANVVSNKMRPIRASYYWSPSYVGSIVQCYSKMRLVTNDSTESGPAVCHFHPDTTWYYCYVLLLSNRTSQHCRRIYRNSSGGAGELIGDDIQPTVGDVYELRAQIQSATAFPPYGKITLNAFCNNSPLFTVEDTTSFQIQAGSIGFRTFNTNDATGVQWDDWEGGWALTGEVLVPVFTVDLDTPVRHTLKMANLVADFGDGFEQRGNKDSAYSRADGEGGVTSYKGRNRFEITMDMLRHINGDATQMANKLWSFYKARTGSYEPFYFYNPAEAPVADPTGVSTTGRYLVRFEQPDLTREHFALFLFKSGVALLEVRA